MGKTKQQKVKDFLINNGVIIVMFILVIYTGLTSNNFFTGNNLMNILMNMSSRLVIALGIAGCVITAGCDLSAGRMIGFGACISGMLLQRLDYSGKFFPDMKPLNVVLVAIIAMLICAAFGTVTGIFIAYLNVPPFIATLAMMEIVYGIGLIVTNATPLGGYVEAYTNVANKKFLGINYLIWIAIIVAAITWFIFNMTRHGKYMYAIGGNPQAAEVAGVPVKKTLILIYMKAAAMYGLAGFMLGAKAGGASVQTGYGYEMEAIAACTIGGVSVTGGRGKVSSAIIYGIGLIVTNATPLGGYVEAYTNVANKKFLGINYLIWIAIIVAAITWFIFNMTRHGKYMYAIGGNPQAAEVAGVPVKKTLILIYMKAAAMYGLAGFMLGAKAGGASVQTGYGYEMEAIAACTIGGVSVTGGRGKVSSAIIGVAVFELLKVALQYLGMNANAQYIAIGVVIFVAISLDIRKYIARK